MKFAAALLACLAFLALTSTAAAFQGTTTRVSVATGGVQENGFSNFVTPSADGRFVAFQSGASNLVEGDMNGDFDVFVHDRQLGTTELVSVATGGEQGNSGSDRPWISADGLCVAFRSNASNLVPGDMNGKNDVFVRDLQLGTTELVSVATDGAQGNLGSFFTSISGDGRFVAFASHASTLVAGDTNGFDDVFVRDRLLGTTERVSVDSDEAEGDQDSDYLMISTDGRFVAFRSSASNLVAGDTNGVGDIFVRDLLLGTTECVSVATGGEQGDTGSGVYPTISADGRFVAFPSGATNLVAGDTNGKIDCFVRDRNNATTELVSVATGGEQGDNDSDGPSISADGRIVAFWGGSTNLVADDTNGFEDVFVHDRQLGTTERVSVATGGEQGNNFSAWPTPSADGRFVGFESVASNLVPVDTNGFEDAFIHDGGLKGAWTDLGSGLPGVSGIPQLTGFGELLAGTPGEIRVAYAAPSALALLFVSTSSTPTPFKGGTLLTVPVLLTLPLATDSEGDLLLPWTAWPSGLSGVSLFFQFGIQDVAAVKGVALSNAVGADVP